MSNSDPSECGELIDIVTNKALTDPMKHTYGSRICGGLKLPTAMYCDDCKADIARIERCDAWQWRFCYGGNWREK